MKPGSAGAAAFLLLIGSTAWGLIGCAATPAPIQFPDPSDSKTETALIRWQRGTEAVTDRAQLSRNPEGAVRIALATTTDSTPLEITLGADGTLFASGSLVGRRWSGPSDRAPAGLRTWVTFLSTWQQAAKLSAGAREIHAPAHRIAYEKQNGQLRSLSVASSDVRESIAAAFLPGPGVGSAALQP